MSQTPTIQPTAEQEAIRAAVLTGQTVAISAGAGTGKTSTLRMIAADRPELRMLYVAYNKAIQLDAAKSFPSNVTCKTAHGLAWPAFGKAMMGRINGPRVTSRAAAQALGIAYGFSTDGGSIVEPGALAAMALTMVARFCHSADTVISRRHFLPPEGMDDKIVGLLAERVHGFAVKAWADMTAPKGKLKPTHDTYLKMWQLSRPTLGYDVVLYDEAQDADPCIADVIENQTDSQIIAVGDSAQAIYGWRGAGDFLARVDAAHRLMLSQSWRFGPVVATEANVWLGVIGADLRLTGSPVRESTIGMVESPEAILCRTNAGTISELLDAAVAGIPAYLVGGGKEILALARAAQRMEAGQPAAHPDLVAFATWADVVRYAEEDPTGSDLAVAVRLIEKYSAETVITAIESSTTQARAKLTISTAHKAKGLEWGSVRISTDFKQPVDKKTGELLPIPTTDAMLAYVAITRAKLALDTGGLSWVHGHLLALSARKAPAVA